jgi:hypothetical protein
MGEKKGAYMVLVGKPRRKDSIGRPDRRWERSVKMDL